jgi:hypothetical protein
MRSRRKLLIATFVSLLTASVANAADRTYFVSPHLLGPHTGLPLKSVSVRLERTLASTSSTTAQPLPTRTCLADIWTEWPSHRTTPWPLCRLSRKRAMLVLR